MNHNSSYKKIMLIVSAALFSALTAISGLISIPLPGTPVPIVLQNMMPVLAGGLLGGVYGTISTMVFLLVGCMGLPVFAGGSGGLASVIGPTGGFLAGYLAASAVTGFCLQHPSFKKKTSVVRICVGCFSGFAVIYLFGIPRFMQVLNMGFLQSLSLTLFPYIPGDLIKLVLSIFLIIKLRPAAARYLYFAEN